MRIGIGYDVHKLVENRKLIIGGVEIPHEKGLHAIADALLGACALGDIGLHFPDTDERYKGADSLKLLSYTVDILKQNGYKIGNIDSIIVAQAPKMRPHIDKMRENIASACGVDVSLISVKATTEEWLGFTGAGEGIAAKAVAVVENI